MKSWEPAVGPREQCAPPGSTRACFPLEGMDCKFFISHSIRHFIPAIVLLEGLFQAWQLPKRLLSVTVLWAPSGFESQGSLELRTE